jgi:hypothetical protein
LDHANFSAITTRPLVNSDTTPPDVDDVDADALVPVVLVVAAEDDNNADRLIRVRSIVHTPLIVNHNASMDDATLPLTVNDDDAAEDGRCDDAS